MAVLNVKYNYLFLSEPYCASRAIEGALLKQDGSWNADTWTHETKDKLIDLRPEIGRHPFFTFSVVRHPADLLVTRYHHLTGWHSKGFKAFLEYIIANPPESRSMYAHAGSTDQTVKYENLSGHLNALLDSLNAPPVDLEVVGKTKEKGYWREYYTPLEMDRLRETFTDFEVYGYE